MSLILTPCFTETPDMIMALSAVADVSLIVSIHYGGQRGKGGITSSHRTSDAASRKTSTVWSHPCLDL